MDPNVSHSIVKKIWVDERVTYFDVFLTAAASAVAPAASKVLGKYVGIMMSATVASQTRLQTRLRPVYRGIRVMPSGLFSSDLQTPDSSLMDIVSLCFIKYNQDPLNQVV